MGLFSNLFSNTTVDFKALIRDGAKVVDVRTPGEFNSGHIQGSINIPLNDLAKNLHKLKAVNSPLILCCASGNRSGMAKRTLQKHELEVHNGGGWQSLQQIIK